MRKSEPILLEQPCRASTVPWILLTNYELRVQGPCRPLCKIAFEKPSMSPGKPGHGVENTILIAGQSESRNSPCQSVHCLIHDVRRRLTCVGESRTGTTKTRLQDCMHVCALDERHNGNPGLASTLFFLRVRSWAPSAPMRNLFQQMSDHTRPRAPQPPAIRSAVHPGAQMLCPKMTAVSVYFPNPGSR